MWRFAWLTDQIETTPPHGEFLLSVFGALAQYERALTRERIMAGPEAANRRGNRGGCRYAIREDTMAGTRSTFGVKRSTLDDALAKETGDR